MSCVEFFEHPTTCGNKVAEICLNEPKSLNALSLDMIELIHAKLEQYRDDDSIVAVILDSSGEKAFCPGGDVVRLYRAIEGGLQQDFVERWFMAEYAMDYSIHKYPKPIICWASGITMGGGMGMMNGCSHRVVTETTRMAMPEVTIALYPDVGASWFFNRMHPGVGQFLSLTASQFNAADALFLGLADRFLDMEKRSQLIDRLCDQNWDENPHHLVDLTLKRLEEESAKDQLISQVQLHYKEICQVTDFNSVVDIAEAIRSSNLPSDWWQRAQSTLAHGSPLSAYVIYQQLVRSRHSSLREAFLSEMILTTRCCQEPELAEGIRALLIDKDKQPDWRFKSLTEVDAAYADSFFQSPWEINPLAELLDRVDRGEKLY